MRWVAFLLFLFFAIGAEAQSAQGKVVDTSNHLLKGAVITLIDSFTHKTLGYVLTKADGTFMPPNINLYFEGIVILSIKHIGYVEYRKPIHLPLKKEEVYVLMPSSNTLKEIVVQSHIPIQVRGDTTIFNAQKYISAEDRKLKDLFNKMPGFQVDDKGRLTYKGNAVEKLFIDGDDLAGNNYELLIKNASVDFVEKLEVIEHFDEDRLMRSVRRTDNVAVNILTKEEYRMRLSGTVDLSTSFEKKRMADITTTLLGKKFKQLIFFNANNAGQNLSEHFKGEVYESSDEKMKEILDENYTQPIISVDQLRLPELDDRITLHNNDIGAFSVMSFNAQKSVKWNGQIGASRTSQWVQKNGITRFNLGVNNIWGTKNIERQENESLDLFSAISFKKDRGGRQTSRGYFVLKRSKNCDIYSNITTGSVQDSMAENLNGMIWHYSARWNHTFQVGRQVMRIVMRSERNDGRQDFSIQTYRLLKYFKLDSAYKYYLQNSTSVLDKHSLEIRFNGVRKMQKFELGWNTTYTTNKARFDQYGYSAKNTDRFFLNASSLSTRFFSSGIYGKTTYTLSPIIDMDIDGRLGVSGLLKGDMKHTIPDFNANVSIKRVINRKTTVYVGGEWVQAFAEWSTFIPSLILTSNARFNNSLQYAGPSEDYSISTGLSSYNVFKNRSFLLNLSYTNSRFKYGVNSIRFPEYSIEGFERYQHYSSTSMMAAYKVFIPAIKSNLNINSNWMDNNGVFQQNGAYAVQRFMNAGLGADLNTGFKGPLNLNIEARLVYFRNQWGDLPVTSNVQLNWSGKVKYNLSKQVYMAGRWKYFEFATRRGFHAVDYFILWNPGKNFDLKLEAINLLNDNSITQRNVNAVSEATSSFLLNGRFFLLNFSFCF